MSKKIALVVTALMVLVSIAFAAENAWIDPNKCAMCKAITETPGLMESMGHEQLPISDGIVCVTTVDDGQLKAYRQAHAKMQDVVARLQKGEVLDLCGSCSALGQIMMKGVKQDYAETQHGDVWILTSDSPAVAAELQAWAKRNTDEMTKLKSASAKPAKM
jgi:hypothetical protein